MTFQEAKTRVVDKTDNQITDTLAGQYINETNQDVIGAYEQYPFMRGTDTTLTTTSGTATYTLTITDFAKPIKLYVGTTEYPRIDLEDSTNPDITAEQHYSVSADGTQITLYPTPTATGTQITLHYLKDVTELSGGSDTPPYAKRFHEILIHGALMRYHEKEEELSKAAYYEIKYNNMLSKLIDFYTRYGKDDVIRMQSMADQYNLDY